jgi:hypothetical protein
VSLPAALRRLVPSQAKILLVGLASTAFESAVSDDAEAVLVGFALLREIFRELEGIFEQLSEDSGVNNLRKAAGKDTEIRERKNRPGGVTR